MSALDPGYRAALEAVAQAWNDFDGELVEHGGTDKAAYLMFRVLMRVRTLEYYKAIRKRTNLEPTP